MFRQISILKITVVFLGPFLSLPLFAVAELRARADCHLRAGDLPKIRRRQSKNYDDADWRRVCLELARAGLPVRGMLLRYPDLVGAGELSIETRLGALKSLGIKNPERMVRRRPELLREEVGPLIAGFASLLRRQGLGDPVALIEARPNVLAWEPSDLVLFFDELVRLGMKSPGKFVKQFPKNLDLAALPKIRGVTAALVKLGFRNPAHMVEIFPTLHWLDVDRIILPKIEHLIVAWGLSAKQIESRASILGASLDRLRALHAYYERAGFSPKDFPLALKIKSVRGLSPSILDRAFALAHADTAHAKRRVLFDARLLSSLIAKSKLERCEDSL